MSILASKLYTFKKGSKSITLLVITASILLYVLLILKAIAKATLSVRRRLDTTIMRTISLSYRFYISILFRLIEPIPFKDYFKYSTTIKLESLEAYSNYVANFDKEEYLLAHIIK
ncbi:hypothetical protein M438DRAFT_360380 [Aureobasidium pullulans EXF-150]|uniref:Uncharacterized protein n=1 Tax=Aureobasidium pullulans EXF-150 TaxID=1043002 RepID=A0A074X917_AURPU|nr:uncharacterized protein M438DRAFT_360380 [Aureobasidium pullulans EXF-150]KEQ78562.1 hypothetical protein M438DRAFT_360380 [Aureobasidium pullulans EXF-150]